MQMFKVSTVIIGETGLSVQIRLKMKKNGLEVIFLYNMVFKLREVCIVELSDIT